MPEPTPYPPGAAWAPPRQANSPQRSAWNPPSIQTATDQLVGSLRGFASPYYSFGLTQRASDDIHVIVRFIRVMIYVGLAVAGLIVVMMIQPLIMVGTLLSRLLP
ncbi:MAG TPA: hypothetical protein DCM67_11485 [Propionibacteriaceae bacterium]|nr:hypothetical protein [Propionibacteriaceae bacterium]